MDQEKKRRLTIDQAEARSTDQASLQKKEILSENSEKFNSHFKFYYDRKFKAIILRTEELVMKKRFVSLSAAQTMVLRGIQKETSGFKKGITAGNLLGKISLKKCDLETINNILKSLVKKQILEEEEFEIRNQKISIFKLRRA